MARTIGDVEVEVCQQISVVLEQHDVAQAAGDEETCRALLGKLSWLRTVRDQIRKARQGRGGGAPALSRRRPPRKAIAS